MGVLEGHLMAKAELGKGRVSGPSRRGEEGQSRTHTLRVMKRAVWVGELIVMVRRGRSPRRAACAQPACCPPSSLRGCKLCGQRRLGRSWPCSRGAVPSWCESGGGWCEAGLHSQVKLAQLTPLQPPSGPPSTASSAWRSRSLLALATSLSCPSSTHRP